MQFLFRLKSSSFQESWLDPPFLFHIYAVVGPEYFFLLSSMYYYLCADVIYSFKVQLSFNQQDLLTSRHAIQFMGKTEQQPFLEQMSHSSPNCCWKYQEKADSPSGSYWKRGVQILDFWIAKRTKRNLPLKNHLSCRDDTKCMLHTIPYITSSWVKPCKIGTWGALPRVQHPLWVNHFKLLFSLYKKQRHSFYNLFQLEDF